jgi:hypothetical protein
MNVFARQLEEALGGLDRRIEKLDAHVERMHGGKKCGKVFWCGGYCDKLKDLMKLRREQGVVMSKTMALMAAERLAIMPGLNDDVLRMIVGYATNCH